MTWLGDKPVITDAQRTKLLAKRDAIEASLKALKATPVGRFQHNVQHRMDDMLKLAKDMASIDKKLGRI